MPLRLRFRRQRSPSAADRRGRRVGRAPHASRRKRRLTPRDAACPVVLVSETGSPSTSTVGVTSGIRRGERSVTERPPVSEWIRRAPANRASHKTRLLKIRTHGGYANASPADPHLRECGRNPPTAPRVLLLIGTVHAVHRKRDPPRARLALLAENANTPSTMRSRRCPEQHCCNRRRGRAVVLGSE